MVFVMRLFLPATVTDDGILQTNGAAAEDDFCSGLGPIGFEVVLRGRKWDKENRDHGGPCSDGDLPKSGVRRGALPSDKNTNGRRITRSADPYRGVRPKHWPVNCSEP